MAFKDHFCPSPWFHAQITNSGDLNYCRWNSKDGWKGTDHRIQDISPVTWFQRELAPIRQSMLAGEPYPGCKNCYEMERNGKVSGRQKQLLKIGVDLEHFDKTLLSSSWIKPFVGSMSDGQTDLVPQDWQIDLGNYCNNACIMCHPQWSSSLATEYQKIGLVDYSPPQSWTTEQALTEFVDILAQAKNLRYLHFIGGETLLTPAFNQILALLIDRGLNQQITLGFTTNLTVWQQRTIDLLTQFDSVNLGMSVECFHPLNDYVRFGSNTSVVRHNAERWLALARSRDWLVQLRTTPTCLSIWHLLTVYDFAWHNKIPVESCNFLSDPRFLRVEILPCDLKQSIVDRIQQWLDQHPIANEPQLINTRDSTKVELQLVQDLASYVQYLRTVPDERGYAAELVGFLKKLEQSRGNCVLDYLPEYEHFLRSSGY